MTDIYYEGGTTLARRLSLNAAPWQTSIPAEKRIVNTVKVLVLRDLNIVYPKDNVNYNKT